MCSTNLLSIIYGKHEFVVQHQLLRTEVGKTRVCRSQLQLQQAVTASSLSSVILAVKLIVTSSKSVVWNLGVRMVSWVVALPLFGRAAAPRSALVLTEAAAACTRTARLLAVPCRGWGRSSLLLLLLL
jgi:hypothetical protein